VCDSAYGVASLWVSLQNDAHNWLWTVTDLRTVCGLNSLNDAHGRGVLHPP
jgi:hypothetical protein